MRDSDTGRDLEQWLESIGGYEIGPGAAHDQSVLNRAPASNRDALPTSDTSNTSGRNPIVSTPNPTGEAANLTSSIKFCQASASSARDLVGEVETFTASLTAAGVSGEPLRLAGTAMELADQLGTTFDDLGGELQRHTVVAESYQAVGEDAGDKQFNQAT